MLEERTSWFPSAAPPRLAPCDSVTLCAHNVSVLRTSPACLHSSSSTSSHTVCPTNIPRAPRRSLRAPSRPPHPPPPGGGAPWRAAGAGGAEGGASGRRRFRRRWRRAAATRGRRTWRRTRRSSSSPKVRTEPNRTEPGRAGPGRRGARGRRVGAGGGLWERSRPASHRYTRAQGLNVRDDNRICVWRTHDG